MKKFWETPLATTDVPEGAQVPESFQIGNVPIAPATILAPMAGVTDTVFRRFIRNASFVNSAKEVMEAPTASELNSQTLKNFYGRSDEVQAQSGRHEAGLPQGLDNVSSEPESPAVSKNEETSGCGLLMTEFTSADGLFRTREKKRKRYLHFYQDEHPISAQLFGSDPVTMAGSAKIVEDAGFDIVDLNLGCPAKRVVKCNGGSGLLKDLPVIRTIFEAVRSAVKIPFTMKFRLGWDDSTSSPLSWRAWLRLRPECGSSPRPHTRAGIQRQRSLGMDCCRERSREDSGDRQRRYTHAGRCGLHGRADKV